MLSSDVYASLVVQSTGILTSSIFSRFKSPVCGRTTMRAGAGYSYVYSVVRTRSSKGVGTQNLSMIDLGMVNVRLNATCVITR